jgi:hypothetical protein
VCTCGVPAETWSSAERFRGVRTSGTRPTQRDFGHGTLSHSGAGHQKERDIDDGNTDGGEEWRG